MEPRGQNISDRLLKFTADVLRFSRTLPRDRASRSIVTQMTDSATSGGANYEEARGAESRQDFIHKVGVSVKELRETTYWIRLAHEIPLSRADVSALLDEANQLTAILTASRKTAQANRQ